MLGSRLGRFLGGIGQYLACLGQTKGNRIAKLFGSRCFECCPAHVSTGLLIGDSTTVFLGMVSHAFTVEVHAITGVSSCQSQTTDYRDGTDRQLKAVFGNVFSSSLGIVKCCLDGVHRQFGTSTDRFGQALTSTAGLEVFPTLGQAIQVVTDTFPQIVTHPLLVATMHDVLEVQVLDDPACVFPHTVDRLDPLEGRHIIRIRPVGSRFDGLRRVEQGDFCLGGRTLEVVVVGNNILFGQVIGLQLGQSIDRQRSQRAHDIACTTCHQGSTEIDGSTHAGIGIDTDTADQGFLILDIPDSLSSR